MEIAPPYERSRMTTLNNFTIAGIPFLNAIAHSGQAPAFTPLVNWQLHQLNGQFYTLTGTLGRVDGSVRGTSTIQFTCLRDNRILASYEVGPDDMPLPISVDVTGVAQLRIEITAGGRNINAVSQLAFAYPTLYGPQQAPTPPPTPPGDLPFHDVRPNDWFYDAVRHVQQNGIMVGTSPTAFEPHAGLTRAMVTTILYRMAHGSAPVPDGGAPRFTDVVQGGGAWWARHYITWAANQSIVQGIGGGRFAPNDLLTREQLATMMHRFAVGQGFDVGVPGHVGVPAGTSNFAREPMRWAVHNGFIGAENPRVAATRADTATFIYQFDLRYGR